MFKKLRNKFLLINVIAIINVLIISFFAVFFITLDRVKTDVKKELAMVYSTRINNPIINDFMPTIIENENNDFFNLRTLSFWIELNEKAEPLVIHSSRGWTNTENLENIAYQLLEKALTKKNASSFFKYGDNYYAYELLSVGHGYRIAFVDITNNVKVLLSFIYSFLLVSILSGIVIVIFSKFAADAAIKPINETYDKQRRFISDASHELKTPLTIINANVDLVLNDKIKKQEKNLNYIKTEGARMTKLINDLLYLSKMEQANDQQVLTRFDFGETLTNSMLAMEALIFEKNLKLNYDIEPYSFVKGDEEKLKQVIIIIMDNAIKYCTGAGKITVNLKRENKEMVLTIENTGVGIDQKDLENIFERFYRADESRNKETGGFGLGLSIAKTIIDEHKGKIKITSIKNKKTTVTIVLPCSE